MKKFCIFIFLLALSEEIFSQCNPAIPSNAVVINTTQTTGFGGSQIWVCTDDTLTSNGGSNTIYLEVGAYLMAGGGSNIIYCPAGATVNIASGSNTIYYVNTVDLISPGGGPTLNQCTNIVYDYTNAPINGCTPTTGTGNLINENGFAVYPNPASENITIKTNNTMLGSTYIITDQTGRQVMTSKFNNETTTVNINQLATGVYLFQVGQQRMQSFKVIKK